MPTNNNPRTGLRSRALRTGVGLGAAAAVLATAAIATASPHQPTTSAQQTNVTFYVHNQPAASEINVALDSGLNDISSQAVAGSGLAAVVTTDGGFTINSLNANSGEDIVTGQLTPGTSITGKATIPSGTTVTASVGGSAPQPVGNGTFSIQVPTNASTTHLGAPRGRATGSK